MNCTSYPNLWLVSDSNIGAKNDDLNNRVNDFKGFLMLFTFDVTIINRSLPLNDQLLFLTLSHAST